jgi:hypothetical protein
MTKRFLSVHGSAPARMLVLILVLSLLAAVPGCVNSGGRRSDATPVPTEPPDLTPAEITLETLELPETYGFLDYLTGSLRTKVAKQYKSQLDAVAVKLGKRFGFNGLASFEFDYNDSRLKPYLIGGEVFVPVDGIAGAFYLERDAALSTDTAYVYRYATRDASLTFYTDRDEVSFGGANYTFRRLLDVEGFKYVDLRNVAKLFDYGYDYDSEGGFVYMQPNGKDASVTKEAARENFDKYDELIYGKAGEYGCDTIGSGLYPKTDPSERLVGIAYTTWFRADWRWGEGRTWDLPLLGPYASDNRDVIYQHGIWLRDAGVDFVFVDWSNDVNYDPATMRASRADFRMIEEATEVLFDVWADIPGAPKICIFTGPGHVQKPDFNTFTNGRMAAKNQQIYDTFIANERFRNMYFYYDGKPLLMCYAATPSFFQNNVSPYEDDRFTMRWVTGYVGQQGSLYDKETYVSKMFWSWEERGAQPFTVFNGKPEAMTVVASSRKQSNPGQNGYIPAAPRNNGETFKKQWERARLIGVKLALVVSWNEWTVGEQPSVEVSKDLEPSQLYGTFYLDLLREQIRLFKSR